MLDDGVLPITPTWRNRDVIKLYNHNPSLNTLQSVTKYLTDTLDMSKIL